MSNVTVNWFEIPARDVARANAFYARLLDIELGRMPGPDGVEMSVFLDGGNPVGALVEGEPSKSGTLVYLNCPDIEAALDRVRAAGGQVLQQETAIGPYGFIAQLVDSEGNRVALHRS